jgi:hypothetical protein
MIRLETPTLTATTLATPCDLGLDLDAWQKPLVANCRTTVRLLGNRRMLVRARFDGGIDGWRLRIVEVLQLVDDDVVRHSPAAVMAWLELEGRDWSEVETKLLASYAKGLES